MSERLRALVVAYAFPPVGGVGVQRAVKLAKYLPEWGVDADVLTVSNPSVPLKDNTFEKDLRGVTVHRAPTLEPGYGVKQASWKASADGDKKPGLRARVLKEAVAMARQLLVPDPQVLWVPGASLKLLQIAGRYDVVIITAPPFSQFLMGPLARLRGTALVLDYRDEWSTLRESYEMLQGGLLAAAGEPLERALLRSCHAVVAATPAFREKILSEAAHLAPHQVHAISNGYDSDDYPDELPEPPTDRMVITYAGTVYKLTSPASLLAVVKRLHEHEPELAKLLEVRFIGRIVDTEMAAFEEVEPLGVKRLGFVPYREVFDLIGGSHMAMCIQGDVAGVERIYPGKIFELMKLGRPVLTISREGELTRLVERHNLGVVFTPRDVDGLYDYMVKRLRAFRDGETGVSHDVDHEGVAQYHRRALAGRWAEALRAAVQRARS